MVKKNKYIVTKLTNKNPTKDISVEDIKFKLFKSTSKTKNIVKVNKKVSFGGK